MTTPVVVMPSPLKLVVDLLRAHTQVPAALTPAAARIVATLPDTFPAGLPFLQVVQVPGAGHRPVPLRLAAAQFDLHLYDIDPYAASELARQVAALGLSLEQRATAAGGITRVDLVSDPWPLPDPEVPDLARWITSISIVYRPR